MIKMIRRLLGMERQVNVSRLSVRDVQRAERALTSRLEVIESIERDRGVRAEAEILRRRAEGPNAQSQS